MNKNMEHLNPREISSRIEFLENEMNEIDIKMNEKCVIPSVCKYDGIRLFPGFLFGKPEMIPLPKKYKVPEFCKDYCYYRFCLLEEQQNELVKQLNGLKSFQKNLTL